MHYFDEDIATGYGLCEAIIFQYIGYVCKDNESSRRNFFDGRYWTYDSIRNFCDKYTYMSKNTIIRSLKKLIDSGLVIEGEFNKLAYDRTKWYTLTDLGWSIYPKAEMDLPKSRNGNTQNQKPIPVESSSVSTIGYIKESDKSDSSSDDNSLTVAVNKIISEWNRLESVGVLPVRKMSAKSKRYQMLRARISEDGVDDILSAINNIRYSPWLLGKNKSGWMIDFDWFVRPNNFPKVFEGKYGKAKKEISKPSPVPESKPEPIVGSETEGERNKVDQMSDEEYEEYFKTTFGGE